MPSATGTVLKKEAERRNLGDAEVARLKEWANNVAELESNNNPSRTQGDSPTGIGRGKYQFEKGGSNTAKVAANRFMNWEKANGTVKIPEEDRKELQKESPDFSVLSEDTQDAVFFIHHSLHPLTPITKIAEGTYPQKDAWIDFHWAGSEKERPKKEKMWDDRISKVRDAKRAAIANTFPEAMQ